MYETTPRKILGYQVLAAVGGALLAFWLLQAGGASLIITVLATVGAAAAGWFAPVYFIELRKRKRFTQRSTDSSRT